jgi:hypothetical protein
MDEVSRTIRYLFILALVLIVAAYWAGSNALLGTGIKGIVSLDNTATGRNSAGVFAAYPK